MKDPVEPRTHQEEDVGILQGQGLRALERKARTSSSARDQAIPLPTSPSGRSTDSCQPTFRQKLLRTVVAFARVA